MRASVIIPTLEEAERLPEAVASVRRQPLEAELLVVDGGSRDGTREVARELGIEPLLSAPGRARQMNAGAALASGDTLLFLHADTRLPAGAFEALGETLADPHTVCGSFPIELAGAGALLRLIERLANLRTRLDRTPYGDQALFVRRADFFAVGGYPDVPLFEELLLARRLRSRGRYRFLRGPAVLTSARRWQGEGTLRTIWRNWLLRLGFELGLSPARLARHYPALAGRGTARESEP